MVKEWAGHADIRTTLKYYLKVSESQYDVAAGITSNKPIDHPTDEDFQLAAEAKGPERRDSAEGNHPEEGSPIYSMGDVVTHGEAWAWGAMSISTNDLAQNPAQKPAFDPSICRKSIAGEGIRTLDVQLGKLEFCVSGKNGPRWRIPTYRGFARQNRRAWSLAIRRSVKVSPAGKVRLPPDPAGRDGRWLHGKRKVASGERQVIRGEGRGPPASGEWRVASASEEWRGRVAMASGE